MRGKNLRVKDVMTEGAVTVDLDTTVSKAISLLKKKGIREVPVLDRGRPVGLVSYTSFIARRSIPLTAKVGAIMMPCPRLSEDMALTKAAEMLMTAGVSGAPVMRGARLVGFLSRSDVVRVLPGVEALASRRVDEVMTRSPLAIREDEPAKKAQIMMEELNEKALPVVKGDGKLSGVVGMHEVFKALWSPKADMPPRSPKPPRKVFDDRRPSIVSVGSIMKRFPIAVSPGQSVGALAKTMTEHGVSTVFVVEDDRLVGVVDQADLMEQLAALRPSGSMLVQLSGMGVQDPEVYDTVHQMTQNSMKRVSRAEAPKTLTIHVSAYHESEGLTKYGISARLTTEKQMYFAKSTGWNLYAGVDSALDTLEKRISRERGKKLSERKRAKSTRYDE